MSYTILNFKSDDNDWQYINFEIENQFKIKIMKQIIGMMVYKTTTDGNGTVNN